MSWTSLRYKEVTTRKGHKCWLCNKPIPIGDKAMNNVGVDGDAGVVSCYHCKCCEAFANQTEGFWSDADEGYSQGDIWEFDEYKAFREKYYQKDSQPDTNNDFSSN